MTATVEQSRSPATTSWWVEHRYLLAIGAITILGAAVRLLGLGSEPFWLDEAHTANFTTLTFGELWSFDPVYNRANPPGYIVLMKAWAQVSRSEEWFRAPSLIAGVITIPLLYLICARMGSRRAGIVAALLLALAGFHVKYSQEARAYAILTMLVAIVILSVVQLVTQPDGDLAQRIRRRPKELKLSGQGLRRPITWTDVAWPAYGLAAGLALHMHNTSLTVPLAASLGVGVWWLNTKSKPPRFIRNWVLANILALAVWAPWIPGFLKQLERVSNSFWATGPTWETAVRDFAVLAKGDIGTMWPFIDTIWINVLVLIGVALLTLLGLRRMDSKYRPVILSFILVHPLAQLLYGLRRPVFLARTLIWISLGVLVAIGFAVSRLRGEKLWLATAGLLVVPVLGTIGYHVAFEKTPWDEAAAIVAAEAGPDDVIFVMSPNNIVPFRHYFREYDLGLDATRLPNDLPDRVTDETIINDSDLESIRSVVSASERVWLVLRRAVQVPNYEDVDPFLRSLARDFEVHDLGDMAIVEYEMN